MFQQSCIRRIGCALVLCLVTAAPGLAATTEIRALLDTDDDIATGCSVLTVDGTFAGVELVHTTTVDTTGGLPAVVAITRASCTDPFTGTFGAPVAITSPYPTPIAVGIGNGAGGAFVVESYLPLAGVPTGGVLHVGFETASATTGDQDALLSNGGAPMTFVVAPATLADSIPTVGEWGLIILGLLLVISALVMMRRYPETRSPMLLVLFLGTATIAYAAGFIPDGTIGDWSGEPVLGNDAVGDVPSADLRAVFMGVEGGIVFFRYDMTSFANTPPVANDQTVTTTQDTPVAITLTGSDGDADPLTFAIASGPASGVLTGTAPHVIYTPNAGFVGNDAFTFTVNDSTVDSAPATVTITVNAPGNTAPVANAQSVTTTQNVAVGITLTGSDADADPLTFAIASGPASGVLTGTAPNLTYTPNAAFVGNDAFTFTVNDGMVDSAPATVSIIVNAPGNTAPVADDQAVATTQDTPIGITLTGSDADADPLTFAIASGPASGVLTGTAPNLTYTPNAAFVGNDSFTFTVNDGTVDSAPATVLITVNAPGNTAPVADDQAVATTQDTPIGITLTGSDADADPLTFAMASGPASGVLTGTAPNVTYTPNAGFVGNDSFTFTVNDGTVDSAPATVTITVSAVNDAPVADPQTVTTPEDTPVAITLTGSDVDTDPLTFAIASGPANGVLTGTAPNVTYTPDANYNGGDSFTFTVNDGTVDSAPATVTITVSAVNDAPAFTSTPILTATENVVYTYNVTTADIDAGDTRTITAATLPGWLVLTDNGDGTAILTGTPLNADVGPNAVVLDVTDAGGLSVQQSFTITVANVNDAPVIDLDADDSEGTTGNDFATTSTEDGGAVALADVDATVTDIDDATIDHTTVTLTNLLDAGQELLDANVGGTSITKSYDGLTGVLLLQGPDTLANFETVVRTVTYLNTSEDPDPTSRLVTFVGNDGAADGPAANATVTVVPQNDAPVVNDQTFSVDENSANGTSVGTVVASDPDAADTLTYAITSGTGTTAFAIAAGTGEITVLDAAQLDFETTPSFTVTVEVTDDGTGPLSDTATITINLNDVNDAPVVNDQTFSVDENSANTTVVGTVVASDPDAGQALSYAITGGTGQTAFAINAGTGEITVADTVQLDFETTPSFSLAVEVTDDGTGPLSDTATIMINLNNVNEAPVITSGATADAPENQTGATTVGATDPETDPVTYTITGGADQGLFAIGGGTGILTFVGAPNFEAPGDAGANNVYDVQVTATATGGSDVINLQITVTNVNEAPIGTADTYSGAGNVAAGNTQFAAGGATPTAVASVSSALSIATNDSDPDAGDTVTYSVASPATTQGGTVVMNANGSFLYTPPSNPAIGSDTFTYTVTDTGLLSDTAVVTIMIEDFVWYVDNANTTAPFNGTSTDPFQTLTAAETVSAANQTIYVFQGAGNYTAGITLKNGQKLFGEGVDLVVTLSGNPVTLVTGNLANKPVVRTTTSSVTVTSAGGAMRNIEIRGLDLGNTATANTVSITEGGNPVSVSLAALDLNTATTAGGTTALSINGGGASTMHVREMQNITVTQGGAAVSGIVATDTIFDADPADANFTGDTVSGGTITIGTPGARLGGIGLSLQNVSGDLSITDLDVFTSGATALDVTGSGLFNAGAGSGFQLTTGAGSTLDATSGAAMVIDPATLALTFTTINSSGSGTSAVRLDSVAGTVTMTGGTLSNATGALFFVNGGTISTTFSGSISQGSNAAAVSVSGGHTTGTLTFQTGTIGATSGTGLQFDNADGTYNFTGTVTLNGGDAGIDVVNGSSGTINFSAGASSITNPTGTAVNLNGSSPAFTYAGSVSKSSAGRLVTFENVTGGSATLSGNLSSTGTSTGILVQNNTGGTFTFSGGTKTINTGTSAAVTLATNNGATMNFSGGGLDIDTTTGAGFIATGGATAVTVTGAGNSVTTTTGTAVDITNTPIGAGGVTFDTVSTNGAANGILLDTVGANAFTASGGSILNASARGVDINGGTGNVSIGATISTTTAGRSVEVTSHTGGTVTLSGAVDDNGLGVNLTANAGSTINFTGGLDIDTVGANTGFNATTGTINVTGSNDINTTAGTGAGLSLTNTAIGGSGMTFTGVSTDGANGILIDTVSGGAITINGGSIASATTRGVDINAGNGNITYAGTISTSGGGARSVEVTARTGGTVTLSGNITDTSLGINISNNTSGTITLSGASKSLSTGANAAVTLGTNGSAIVNFTGGGLVISRTTGAGLSATVSGTLNITGSGNIINSGTSAAALTISSVTIGASGVTFQSISQNGGTNGIVLSSTGASGGGLTVSGTGGAGSGGTIQNTTGVGISLTSTREISLTSMNVQNGGNDGIFGSSVTNFALSNSTISSNGNAVQERGIEFTNLLGNATITNSTITGSAEDNLYVLNNTGTLTMLTITGSTFSNTSATVGNDGIYFHGNSNANMSISVSNCVFTNNRGDHFQATTDAVSAAIMDVTFQNNDLNGSAGNLGAGLTLNPGGTAQITFDILNNGTLADPFSGAVVSAITINSSNNSVMSGTISGNVIGNPAVTDSGSTTGDGITVFANNTSAITIAITNNRIREYSNLAGINIHVRDGASDTIHATITGNTISDPGTFASHGILAQAGSVAGDTGFLCLDIGGAGALANSIAGSGANGGDDFRVRQRISTSVRLPGYGGSATDTAGVVVYIQGRNTGSETGSATVQGAGFLGGAACTQP